MTTTTIFFNSGQFSHNFANVSSASLDNNISKLFAYIYLYC